ncbi:hypothetical protein [Viridibacillus arvi]|uniref:hypothetical protein n=1 Tax=Viridibacillus arvi TaxID=263475 RepID=UPI0034CE6B10
MQTKIREIKEWIGNNKVIAIAGGTAIVVFTVLFLKMFIELLPLIGLGIGAFILYKLYKRGYLG